VPPARQREQLNCNGAELMPEPVRGLDRLDAEGSFDRGQGVFIGTKRIARRLMARIAWKLMVTGENYQFG